MHALAERLAQKSREHEQHAPADRSIASAVGQPGLGVDERVALIGSDPALAAAVLRAASPGPSTLRAAVWKLGEDSLTRVAIEQVARGAHPGALAAIDRQQRQHARLAAALARELAARRGIAPEEAFLAGLLHDIGALIVTAAIEREPLPALHRAALVDEHHVDAGRLVATRWHLSPQLADAIAHHHAPQHCQRLHRPLVQLVSMVDNILAITARPDLGLAALTNVAGLDHDERFRVRTILHQAAALAALPRAIDDDVRWPVRRPARLRQTAFMTSHVSASSLVLRGTEKMEVGWLTELVVEDTSPVVMLVNIQACHVDSDGVEIIARPFGLDGPTREAWMRLVKIARTPGESS
jgi:putative nucleotidyltransferase with HDIG domain